MKTWIDLHDYYLDDVPGCTYASAANALRKAAQEFCETAKVWRVTLPAVPTVANQSIYAMGLTAEQEVSKVLEASLAGQDIALLLHDAQGTNEMGMIVLNRAEYLIQPTPAKSGQAIVVKAILKPSNASTGIEDFIYAAHAEAIGQGAKARLFAMSNQQFSDPVGAIAARQEFERLMSKAKIEAAKAYSSAPLRVQPSFM